MNGLTWWLYYYGIVAGFLIVYEIVIVRETGELFNPITQPYITLPIMIGVLLFMVLPTVYFKYIKDKKPSV